MLFRSIVQVPLISLSLTGSGPEGEAGQYWAESEEEIQRAGQHGNISNCEFSFCLSSLTTARLSLLIVKGVLSLPLSLSPFLPLLPSSPTLSVVLTQESCSQTVEQQHQNLRYVCMTV